MFSSDYWADLVKRMPTQVIRPLVKATADFHSEHSGPNLQLLGSLNQHFTFLAMSLCSVEQVTRLAKSERSVICPRGINITPDDNLFEVDLGNANVKIKLNSVNKQLFAGNYLPQKLKPWSDENPFGLVAIANLKGKAKDDILSTIIDLQYEEFLANGSLFDYLTMVPSSTTSSSGPVYSFFQSWLSGVYRATPTPAKTRKARQASITATTQTRTSTKAPSITPKPTTTRTRTSTKAPSITPKLTTTPTPASNRATNLNRDMNLEVFLLFSSEFPDVYSLPALSLATAAPKATSTLPSGWEKAIHTTKILGPFEGDEPLQVSYLDRAELEQILEGSSGRVSRSLLGMVLGALSVVVLVLWL